MIKSVEIYFPNTTSFFEIGQKVIRDKEVTNVKITEIKIMFNCVRIKMSDEKELRFYRLPFSVQAS